MLASSSANCCGVKSSGDSGADSCAAAAGAATGCADATAGLGIETASRFGATGAGFVAVIASTGAAGLVRCVSVIARMAVNTTRTIPPETSARVDLFSPKPSREPSRFELPLGRMVPKSPRKSQALAASSLRELWFNYSPTPWYASKSVSESGYASKSQSPETPPMEPVELTCQ